MARDLTIKITADGAQAKTELAGVEKGIAGVTNASAKADAQVQKQFDHQAEAAKKIGAALGAIFSIQKITAAVDQVSAATSRIADAASRMSISAEAVQKLGFAAKQSGSSIEAIAVAMGRMSDALGSADADAKLAKLGLSLEHIKGLSPDQTFLAIAEAARKMEDPLKQADALTDLWGRGALELLPAVKAGFVEVGDQAPLMSNAVVEAGDRAGDALQKMRDRMDALKAQALVPLMGAFTQLPEAVQIGAAGILGFLPSLEALALSIMAAGGPVAALGFLKVAAISVKGAFVAFAWPVALTAAGAVGIWEVGKAFKNLIDTIRSGGSVWEFFTAKDDDNFIRRWLGLSKAVDETGVSVTKAAGAVKLMSSHQADLNVGVVHGTGITETNTAANTRSEAAIRKVTEATDAAAEKHKAFMLEVAKIEDLKMLNAELDAAMGGYTGMAETADYARREQAKLNAEIESALGLFSNYTSSLDFVQQEIADLNGLKVGPLFQEPIREFKIVETKFQALKGIVKGSLGDLNQVFMSAFEGGGGLGGAIKSLGTNMLSGLLSMVPGIGPILSQFSGAIMAGLSKIGNKIKGLFGGGEEGTQVNPARDAFLSEFGGAGTGAGSGFLNLAARLTEVTGEAGGGSLFNALTQADTMAEFDSAVAAIKNKLASVHGTNEQGFDDVTKAAEGLNYTVEGSDEAIAALGKTQDRVVNAMLDGFDKLILKLDDFIARLSTVGGAMGSIPLPDMGGEMWRPTQPPDLSQLELGPDLYPPEVFHNGGMVWRKAHRGMNLAADEVPIIAQTGERVLNRRETAAYNNRGNMRGGVSIQGGVTLNLHEVGNKNAKEIARELVPEFFKQVSRYNAGGSRRHLRPATGIA
jgi:hypothetical protein